MSTSESPKLAEVPLALHLPTKSFKAHTEEPVSSVAYINGGKRIVTGSGKLRGRNTIRIWNLEDGEEDESMEHNHGMWGMKVLLGERMLAVCEGKIVTLWNLESREVVWTAEVYKDGSWVTCSPDGKLIAVTRGEEILLLDAESGQQITGKDPLRLGEHVRCLAFSPDGTRLAAGSNEGKFRVFDVATGETVVGPIDARTVIVMVIVFTLDGQQLVTAGYAWDWSEPMRVWNSTTGAEVGEPMEHGYHVEQISLCPDGRRLASAAADQTGVYIWDLSTHRRIGEPLQLQLESEFDPEDYIQTLAVTWSPNGQSIIAATNAGCIYLWDDLPQAPVVSTPSPPALPSTSRPRGSSLSSSLLDLPAEVPPPIQSRSTDQLPDDFFDDLPASTPPRPQISTIPIAQSEVPLNMSIPRPTKSKTVRSVPASTPASSNTVFGRIGARFRSDKHAAEAIEMHPPPPKLPKYSPVGRVALAEADARLYVDKSKDKKQRDRDDESAQPDWVDVEVNCWDIFRAAITSCCSSRRDSQSDDE